MFPVLVRYPVDEFLLAIGSVAKFQVGVGRGFGIWEKIEMVEAVGDASFNCLLIGELPLGDQMLVERFRQNCAVESVMVFSPV